VFPKARSDLKFEITRSARRKRGFAVSGSWNILGPNSGKCGGFRGGWDERRIDGVRGQG